MKEFESTTGGRHVYNSDFKNLQELALATQQIFADFGGNFVISGCKITTSNSVTTVSEGYVYIDGRIRKVASASNVTLDSTLMIVGTLDFGTSIPYVSNAEYKQYTDYEAEVVNKSSSDSSNEIAYSTSFGDFPNLANTFFNNYAVSKKASDQILNKNLSVTGEFTASGKFTASNGVTLADKYTVTKVTGGIVITCEDLKLTFKTDGSVTVSNASTDLFSFGNASGTGTVTFYNITASNKVTAKTVEVSDTLTVGGSDIADMCVPVGVVEMWGGLISQIPDTYILCDGREVLKSNYPKLATVLGQSGTSFNVPDLTGRFIVGYGTSDDEYSRIGNSGGKKEHTLTAEEIPAHTHPLSMDEVTGSFNVTPFVNGTQVASGVFTPQQYDAGSNTNGLAGGNFWAGKSIGTETYKMQFTPEGTANAQDGTTGKAHENRPPYYVLAYIIKAK